MSMSHRNTPSPLAGPSQPPSRLALLWRGLRTRLAQPSRPSDTSDSGDEPALDADLVYPKSISSDSQHLPVDFLYPDLQPRRTDRQLLPKRHANARLEDEEPSSGTGVHAPVSHLVVDNDFEHLVSAPEDAQSDASGGARGDDGSLRALFGKGEPASDKGGAVKTETSRDALSSSRAYELARRLWDSVLHFFCMTFPEPAKERSYQKEAWFTQKQGAIAAASFFLICWILTVALLPKPFSKFSWSCYFFLSGLFALPVLPMVIFDVPRNRPYVWQVLLFFATWAMADIEIIDMRICGYYNSTNTCGDRTFNSAFALAFGQPVLAILALRLTRFWAIVGASQWIILTGILVANEPNTPQLFYRDLVNFVLFHAFLIAISFFKDTNNRQRYELRNQLKMQFRATQAAQVMEKRASDSKKRFVSYIFHEVRVPLNTALLAVQNLEGEEVFKGIEKEQSEMVHGLMGSLTMMEKVLNDVLSFNRMESGRLAQARKPFEFHQSIQLVALSHRMQAQTAGVDLIIELDPEIDRLGGTFIGDEMRLRQVTSNLVSNSIKFTSQGSVKIVTRLVYALEADAAPPVRDERKSMERARVERLAKCGRLDLEKGNIHVEAERCAKRIAVVRVEVHDTGVGLKQSDLDDNRLFSPYVQTEIGRRQGGKGTGLGLALVRQIVKLSHGRLGVESQCGKGSIFWFELPYTLPKGAHPPCAQGGEKTGVARSVHLAGSGLKGENGSGSSPDVRVTALASSTGAVEKPRPGQSEPENAGTASSKERSESDTTYVEVIMRGAAGGENVDSNGKTPEPASPTETPVGPADSVFPAVPPTPGIDMPPADTSLEARESDRPLVPVPANVAAAARPLGLPPDIVHAPPPPTEGEPLNVLVVDDDKLTRALMSRMLTRWGHRITTADNGKQGFESLLAATASGLPFDAVFLDNQMPFMTGVEVARAARRAGCGVYIIGCTGNALREDQDEYLAAGADEVLTKPIHQHKVLEGLAEARRRARGETAPTYVPPEHEGERAQADGAADGVANGVADGAVDGAADGAVDEGGPPDGAADRVAHAAADGATSRAANGAADVKG